MSSICGIYRFEGQAGKTETQASLQAISHWQPDNTGFWQDGPVAMGHALLQQNFGEAKVALPWQHPSLSLVITADARLDYRQELVNKLNKQGVGLSLTDNQLILHAYLKWGEECAHHLQGDFAFALWDGRQGKFFCARDHIGCRPFFYFLSDKMFAFASEIKGLKPYQGISTSLDEEWIVNTVTGIKSAKDKTPFHGVLRLLPGHTLTVSSKGATLQKYWELSRSPTIHYAKEEDYVLAFREKLSLAVQCRTRSSFMVACELSGGVDSSSVTAMAARQGKVVTFSHAMPDDALGKIFPYQDERDFIQQVLQFHEIEDSVFCTAENRKILPALERSLFLQDAPPQQFFHSFSDELYEKVSARGARTLLSGFGGDELVSYQGAGYLNQLAARGKLGKLVRELARKNYHKPWNIPLGALVLTMKEKYPGIYFLFKEKSKKPAWLVEKYKALALDPAFEKEWNIQERFFLGKGFPSHPSLKERQLERILHQHVPQRLELSAIAARSWNIDYAYPLLDKKLMEFYMGLPDEMKYCRGWGRYILRKSMQGLLPPSIQWRNDKTGATVPTVFMRLRGDEENVGQLIHDARARLSRHYLDYDKLLVWLDRNLHRGQVKTPANPGAFHGALSVLLYQIENIM